MQTNCLQDGHIHNKQDVSPFMKDYTKSVALPALNSHGRHRQARRIPENLNRKIAQFWKDRQGVGEKISPSGDDAIVSYFITKSSPQRIRLVHSIQARIYKKHLGRPRRDFPQRASDARMIELGGQPGDDKGHILAFSLGTHTNIYLVCNNCMLCGFLL
jgi:hypothetical protein